MKIASPSGMGTISTELFFPTDFVLSRFSAALRLCDLLLEGTLLADLSGEGCLNLADHEELGVKVYYNQENELTLNHTYAPGH